jgi:ADP-ribosylation factor-like protein 5B
MSAAEISRQLNLQNVRKHKWQIQSCCGLTGEGYAIFFIIIF